MVKRWIGGCIAFFFVVLCAACQESPEQTPAQVTETTFAAVDLEVGYDETTSVEVVFQDNGVQISGDGVTVDQGLVSITQGGTYVLSGQLNGQISVDASGQEVHLVFAGLQVSSNDGPAVGIGSDCKVVLTLEAGTENSLTDSETYTPEAGEDEPNACLYTKSDLTINGEGSLTVTGKYNHGIYSKDGLTITGGHLQIEAVNDGLKGKDYVTILTTDLAIQAGGDGIQSNAEDGYISIQGGTFAIHAGFDGIQAETTLEISGGTFTMTTGGGSENGVVHLNGQQNMGWGTWGSTETDTSDSAKGLKAGSALAISGGEFTLDCSDDTLHSNGSVDITDGVFTLASGDDGVHADEALTIAGGTLAVTTSYEGLEGNSITVADGEISIVATDDGLNAAGGSDETWGFDRDQFGNSDIYLRISGGTLTIDAGGDGMDSNGNLYVNGGTVIIDGPSDSANGSLDYAGAAEITGGTVLAVSGSGMAEGFTDGSTQYAFMQSFSSAVSGGTEMVITDSDGHVIFRHTPDKSYQCVVFSSPELTGQATYTVTAGEQSIQVTLTQTVTNSGGFTGGIGGGFGGGQGMGEMPGGGMGGDPGIGEPPDGGMTPGEAPGGGSA